MTLNRSISGQALSSRHPDVLLVRIPVFAKNENVFGPSSQSVNPSLENRRAVPALRVQVLGKRFERRRERRERKEPSFGT
ncbi:MAG TPA: hypothetical protein PK411_05595 [Mesotoga infera]|jgi:hypothetical protein|nr:hypothetical protein [Mesotoga sp.]HPD37801.1 hypothetical protein [Mesotoga infera]HRR44088.1 hypothetical protein [Mesotoga sp.]HRV01190.1 hypothetical protein [Mesotoga sp.]